MVEKVTVEQIKREINYRFPREHHTAKYEHDQALEETAVDIQALYAPFLAADEELGRCVDDLETAGRENAGLKREIARLKEQLDFVIDPARATDAQHTIKAMAGERDELREEIARLGWGSRKTNSAVGKWAYFASRVAFPTSAPSSPKPSG